MHIYYIDEDRRRGPRKILFIIEPMILLLIAVIISNNFDWLQG
jgi:hypothetical protein